jgi:hypothetical protein
MHCSTGGDDSERMKLSLSSVLVRTVALRVDYQLPIGRRQYCTIALPRGNCERMNPSSNIALRVDKQVPIISGIALASLRSK